MRISDWSSDVCSSDLSYPQGWQGLSCCPSLSVESRTSPSPRSWLGSGGGGGEAVYLCENVGVAGEPIPLNVMLPKSFVIFPFLPCTARSFSQELDRKSTRLNSSH